MATDTVLSTDCDNCVSPSGRRFHHFENVVYKSAGPPKARGPVAMPQLPHRLIRHCAQYVHICDGITNRASGGGSAKDMFECVLCSIIVQLTENVPELHHDVYTFPSHTTWFVLVACTGTLT